MLNHLSQIHKKLIYKYIIRKIQGRSEKKEGEKVARSCQATRVMKNKWKKVKNQQISTRSSLKSSSSNLHLYLPSDFLVIH